MATAQMLSDYLSSLTPYSFSEDRVHVGDPRRDVTGVLICWMANTRAIDQAVRQGCNAILCHETPFIIQGGAADPGPSLRWRANVLRRELLERHGMTVVQAHRTVDTLCIADVFRKRAGLGEAAHVEEKAGYDAVRLFDVPPRPVQHYIDFWKQAHALDKVRAYVRDPRRVISRVGLSWGGIGLVSNLDVVGRLIELGADVLLGGETEEYMAEFCADAGVDFVEIGHAATEAPGMKVAGEILRRRFPQLRVSYFEEWPLMRLV